MTENKRSKGVHVGTSSILIIFILLSLVTFASLSFLSARSDYLLSCKMASRTTDYYAADTKSAYYTANVEGLLSKHYRTCNSRKEFEQSLAGLFDDNDAFTIDTTVSPAIISYTMSISETQNLYVELEGHYPTEQDCALYHIVTWRTFSTVDWQPDNTLKLTNPILEE